MKLADERDRHAIASYTISKGRLYLMHTGVHIQRELLPDIEVPYSSIVECSYFHRLKGTLAAGCIIRYIDKSKRPKTLKFCSATDDPVGALKAHHGLLHVSKKQGHRLRQKADDNLARFAGQLKNEGVESEYLEPKQLHLETSVTRAPGTDATRVAFFPKSAKFCWERELGNLRVGKSNVDLVEVRERGDADVFGTYMYPLIAVGKAHRLRPQYQLDFIVKIDPVPQIRSNGEPSKGFLRRIVSYQWQGGSFAEKLNQDDKLINMLRKAKAPRIQVKSNRISIESKRFPTVEVFQCIDRIAGHIRKEVI